LKYPGKEERQQGHQHEIDWQNPAKMILSQGARNFGPLQPQTRTEEQAGQGCDGQQPDNSVRGHALLINAKNVL
jgi:hypothetical protein